MELTPEQLEKVEEYAGLLFSPAEIAIVLELDELLLLELIKDCKHSAFKKYQRGLLLTKAKINKSIVQHAEQGSNTAQDLAMKQLNKLEMIL
jgi:hypothetical protein